jgi:hypothetical protein
MRFILLANFISRESLITKSQKWRPLEKTIVGQVVKKLYVYMEFEYPLPCSQEPATGSCPEPNEYTLILSSHLGSIFQMVSSF